MDVDSANQDVSRIIKRELIVLKCLIHFSGVGLHKTCNYLMLLMMQNRGIMVMMHSVFKRFLWKLIVSVVVVDLYSYDQLTFIAGKVGLLKKLDRECHSKCGGGSGQSDVVKVLPRAEDGGEIPAHNGPRPLQPYPVVRVQEGLVQRVDAGKPQQLTTARRVRFGGISGTPLV
ncbi:hypothetical protein CEXT_672391 [Caerostris extrusa]|uniref:Uncharacterized protein n=1 Tax=Caerostris extrusa TaxID=172846 RepID=A0AAV4P1D7_CAEEX|nr:hypothetical protein CEXT_672391 [Caerostris extrusa]